jgi:hypothetical protein
VGCDVIVEMGGNRLMRGTIYAPVSTLPELCGELMIRAKCGQQKSYRKHFDRVFRVGK